MSTVLYFSAQWCGPCKAMKPIVEEFEAEYSEPAVIKIDADDEFKLAQEHKIQAVPTFILLSEEGEEIRRHKGPMNQKKFEEFALGE
jgi:thioredoxin 1